MKLKSNFSFSFLLSILQVQMLEKRYGGRNKSQNAARIIQEAYRKYQLQKEFQRLKRTRSDSRISSYLKNFSGLDIHSKHSHRARVMVIEDVESSSPSVRESSGMGKLEDTLVEERAEEELETLKREIESNMTQAIIENSIATHVRPQQVDRHRNNSNNVFPKAGMSPAEKGSSGGVESKEPGSGKKVVVTLTMTKHNSSIESHERGQTSRSEKTIITQKDFVRVQSEEVWKTTPHKGGSGSPPSPRSPGGSPPSSGRAVTKIITTSEKQVAMKVCIPEVSGSPAGVRASSPGTMSTGGQTPSPVVVKASELPSRAHCGFVVTGISDSPQIQGSASPISPKTVSVGNSVMSPIIDRKVGRKESPSVQTPVGVQPAGKEGRKPQDTAAETSHVSPPAKHADGSGESENSRPARTDSIQEVAERKSMANSSSDQSIETSSPRASLTMGLSQENSNKRESVSSSGSTGTESDVTMEYARGGRRLAHIHQAEGDSLSTTSTISGESFEVISMRGSVSDVPSVTVATPEGSSLNPTMDYAHSSTDSDVSDTEGDYRHRSQSGSQHVASSAKRQMSKANSTGQMDSPVWKRKSPDTRIATRDGMLMNGSATPVRMSRSDTGDSMSSESSGSSKYTLPDDSSISESTDTLPGEIEELCQKRTLVPSLSIPMTPSRRRRYRVGINLFNK